jgi:hypothetical protein
MNRRRFLELIGLAFCAKAIPIPHAKPLIFNPTPEQIKFFNSPPRMMYYGGAAGYSKSVGLIDFNSWVYDYGRLYCLNPQRNAVITNIEE